MHATKTVPCKSDLKKLLQRAIHTSPVCSSAQAFRTRDIHFPLFVCRRRLRGIHTFAFRHSLLEQGVHTFRTSTTHTRINRHINWHQHAIVESTRVVKAFDESYGSMDSWGQLCDGVILPFSG